MNDIDRAKINIGETISGMYVGFINKITKKDITKDSTTLEDMAKNIKETPDDKLKDIYYVTVFMLNIGKECQKDTMTLANSAGSACYGFMLAAYIGDEMVKRGSL
jgi:hypothetical protein